MRVLVLGAGFGGLELTTRLSEEFGGDADVVLIKQGEGFVFGFSKLDVMFGRTAPSAVIHPYVADRIGALVRGTSASTEYDGNGLCYLEFGENQAARVDVTFLSGQSPTGDMEGPSPALAADKAEFGSSRIQRWFGRDWPSVEEPII